MSNEVVKTNMEIKKEKREFLYRLIFRVTGFLILLFFLTMPLMHVSNNTSQSASAYEIATGSGELFNTINSVLSEINAAASGYPVAFVLLLIPGLILILSFTKVPYIVISVISAAGVLAKIVFVIVMSSQLNSDVFHFIYGKMESSMGLTAWNFIIMVLYVGLAVFGYFIPKIESGYVDPLLPPS